MTGRDGFNPAPTNAKTWFDKLTTLSKIEGQRTLREYFKGAGCGDEQSRNELPRNKSARYQGIIRDYFSEVVTPECFNRGSSQSFAWIPA